MAKRHRVRASRAQRKREREAEQATIARLMERFRGRLTTAEAILEAENELLIHKARMAGNRRARVLRAATARLLKARATGYLRGQTPETILQVLRKLLKASPPAPGPVAQWSGRAAL